ncbi:MAG: prepilin-type N-terminal cleavage/methylation domain-containing protein [Rhodoferax sp.]|nr:prepilin-type N-terminal cleavage/methylation domain-containing protein [Rhodoferax sp.]MBP7490966.1 prepilin-type N-terminal cleavage/methylation domain-containing protein [Rhodoferax sp.]
MTKTVSSQQGMALIEVLVAVLLVSLGMLGLVGLQSASVAMLSDTRYRVEAAALTDELMSRIWIETSSNSTLPAYANDATVLPADWLLKVNRLPGAAAHPPLIEADTNVIVLTIRWQPPNGFLSSHRVVAVVMKNAV